MSHGLLGSKPFLREKSATCCEIEQGKSKPYRVIISKEFVQEINGLVRDEALILGVDEGVPGLAGEAGKYFVILRVQFNLIFVQVLEELFSSEDLGDLHQLVRVAVSVEERFLAENHRRKHRTKGPHVQRIVVFLEVNK
jgi:hypothetical protein